MMASSCSHQSLYLGSLTNLLIVWHVRHVTTRCFCRCDLRRTLAFTPYTNAIPHPLHKVRLSAGDSRITHRRPMAAANAPVCDAIMWLPETWDGLEALISIVATACDT